MKSNKSSWKAILPQSLPKQSYSKLANLHIYYLDTNSRKLDLSTYAFIPLVFMYCN